LREAGIVVDEKHGKQVIYRLALPCVVDFIQCLEFGICHDASLPHPAGKLENRL
jgi:hypothetical protein